MNPSLAQKQDGVNVAKNRRWYAPYALVVHDTVCVCSWVNPKLIEQREAEAAAALSASLPKVLCGLSLLGKYLTKAMSDSTPRRRLITQLG